MTRWLFFLTFFCLVQWYAFQAIKTLGLSRWMIYLYFGLLAVVLGNFLYHTLNFDRATGFTPSISLAAGIFMSVVIFQLIVIFFLAFEDLLRVPQAIYHYFIDSKGEQHWPNRRKFISQLAIGLAAIPFASLLIGMIRGKYNYKVLHYVLEFDDLPEAFDGYTLTQISDIHSGSFDNPKKVNYGIDLINQQNADVILFTGDIVNNKAEELLPWKNAFGRLKAKDGVFSILGNHDYGDYVQWNNRKEKEDNLKLLLQTQSEMGFKVLLNETHFIEKDGQRLAIVGVENWGKGGFKKAGDLQKAVTTVNPNDFKILLSHDPSHWEAEVLPHAFPFQLTLSGHTHGMQFGIEIPGWFKWSPVKWRYKQWAGLYEQNKQWINVNRGFGFLGYPGRVGIWPEITVISLKRSKKEV